MDDKKFKYEEWDSPSGRRKLALLKKKILESTNFFNLHNQKEEIIHYEIELTPGFYLEVEEII